MKKTFLIILSLLLLIVSCKKKDTASNCQSVPGQPSAAEIAAVQNYLTSKSITAIQHPAGFFYTITTPGSGDKPNINSTVKIAYKGSLTDGSIFDQTQPGATATFPLSGLIYGWQVGIPLIARGGEITLYLPPSLGYGCQASSRIPAGSILIFDVRLIDF